MKPQGRRMPPAGERESTFSEAKGRENGMKNCGTGMGGGGQLVELKKKKK